MKYCTWLCVKILHRNVYKSRILHRNTCTYGNTINIYTYKFGLCNRSWMVKVMFWNVAVPQIASSFGNYCLFTDDELNQEFFFLMKVNLWKLKWLDRKNQQNTVAQKQVVLASLYLYFNEILFFNDLI